MKKASVVSSVIFGLCLSNAIYAKEPRSDGDLQHAIYVAFQTPSIFTKTQIKLAQKQVLTMADTGNVLAQYVEPKLAGKIIDQSLAQR